MTTPLAQALAAAIGADKVLTGEADLDARRHDYWAASHIRDLAGTGAPRPTCIARPTSAQDVQKILAVARQSGAPVIPFGLGSGVVGGVVASPEAIVLDMGAMNRTRFIDEINLLAAFEAGKNGLEAEEALAAEGLTIGHWPQSVAVSSVGGWVATRASGQFSTAYGNIEDIVYAIEAVTPDGQLVKLGKGPRASAGPDLRQLMLGSEGTLGVITAVTLSLRRAPQGRALSAFSAPDMETGFAFQREVIQSGWRPPVVRQYDEREARRLEATAEQCLVLMVHEGATALVDCEKAAVEAIASAKGLKRAPESIVENWLAHRNTVSPWDRILSRGIVADTVEVSAAWDAISAVYRDAVASLGEIEGCLAASAHSSHVYRSGLNLYFTFAVQTAGPAEMEGVYTECWRRIMEATARHGGSLAHHHGIGRVRRAWLETELGVEGVGLLRQIKEALDPAWMMNPGVLLPDA